MQKQMLFFCFTQIMSEIMNNFCTSLDHSEMGIKGQMEILNQLLKKKDLLLWKHLESIQLDPQYYSFRWITLLLSQEFELPDVLRLWDSFFADEKRFSYLLYMCAAMLILVRDKLLNSGFGDALKLLQKYTVLDINELINLADEISSPDFQISSLENSVYINEENIIEEEETDPISNFLDGLNDNIFSFMKKLSS